MTKRRPLSVLALPIPGTVTPTALQLHGQLPFAKYLETARLLGRIGHGVQWWLGDLLIFGEARYGEKYAQAEVHTGFEPGTLANIASVCSKVESSRRRETLSFGHHAEVAKFEPAEQTKWLEKAEQKGWTRTELRRQLKGEDGGSSSSRTGSTQDASEVWQRLRQARDIVKGAREKLDRFPEHVWEAVEVKNLIVRLEQALFVEG